MLRRLVIMLSGSLLVAGCIYTFRTERPETRQWPADGLNRIVARTANGRIAVHGGRDSLVRALITRRAWGWYQTDAEKHLGDIIIRDELTAGQLTLTAEFPTLNNHNLGADFELTVPESAAVRLNTSNGDIEIAGVRAGIDARTSNGRIRVRESRGGAGLSTSNGEVALAGTSGAYEIHTSNGKVSAVMHRGSLDVTTSNGAVECDVAALCSGESVSLQTSNGRITLTLPVDINATFDAATSRGEVELIGFPAVHYQRNDPEYKAGSIGAGGILLTLTTSNGPVEIRAR